MRTCERRRKEKNALHWRQSQRARVDSRGQLFVPRPLSLLCTVQWLNFPTKEICGTIALWIFAAKSSKKTKKINFPECTVRTLQVCKKLCFQLPHIVQKSDVKSKWETAATFLICEMLLSNIYRGQTDAVVKNFSSLARNSLYKIFSENTSRYNTFIVPAKSRSLFLLRGNFFVALSCESSPSHTYTSRNKKKKFKDVSGAAWKCLWQIGLWGHYGWGHERLYCFSPLWREVSLRTLRRRKKGEIISSPPSTAGNLWELLDSHQGLPSNKILFLKHTIWAAPVA